MILQKTGKQLIPLTQSDINTQYEKAIENECVYLESNLNNISFLNDRSISIQHNSKNIEAIITDQAYNDLLNVTLFNKQMNNTFLKILKDKTKTIETLNHFKNEYVKNNNINLILIGDKYNKNIIGIKQKKKDFNIIKNEQFLKIVSKAINKYNLKISDFNVDNLGQININTFIDDKNDIIIHDSTIKDCEQFHRGLHFMSKINDYKIIPSTIRIHCTNQLTLNQLEEAFILQNDSDIILNRMGIYLDQLKENKFMPKHFIKQVKKSYITPASLREFEYVTDLMKRNSKIEKEEQLDEFINYTEIKNTFKLYEEQNHIDLTHQMKSQIPTNKTVWEIVNSMTYMASNASDTLINDTHRSNLAIESGRFLRGDAKNNTFDLQLLYNTPFHKNWNS